MPAWENLTFLQWSTGYPRVTQREIQRVNSWFTFYPHYLFQLNPALWRRANPLRSCSWYVGPLPCWEHPPYVAGWYWASSVGCTHWKSEVCALVLLLRCVVFHNGVALSEREAFFGLYFHIKYSCMVRKRCELVYVGICCSELREFLCQLLTTEGQNSCHLMTGTVNRIFWKRWVWFPLQYI